MYSKNKIYHVKSGLGGTFPVKYIGTNEHGDLFEIVNKQSDFNGQQHYYKPDEVKEDWRDFYPEEKKMRELMLGGSQ